MSSEEVAGHIESGDLIGAMGALARAAGGIREEMRKKLIRNAIIMGCLLVVSVAAIVIGAYGWRATVDANTQRDAARIASCKQSNKAVQATADADKASFHDFIDYLVSLSARPVDKTLVKVAKDTQDAKIQRRADLPPLHRTCTTAGIRKYLASAA